MKVVKEYPELCTILGHIHKASLSYGQSNTWVVAPTALPPSEWDINILVIWSSEARKELSESSFDWYRELKESIPEAVWITPVKTLHIPKAFKDKHNDCTLTH